MRAPRLNGGHPTAAIGTALTIGIGIRISAGAGVVLMWSAVLPPDSDLFMDDHLVCAVLFVGLARVSGYERVRCSSEAMSRSAISGFPGGRFGLY